MARSISKAIYARLLNDISLLFDKARNTLVRTYWHIGKLIVTVEQQGSPTAQYGASLIRRLSHDLTKKFGKGFSETNIKNMRKLYLTYPNRQPADDLAWSQYVALLPIDSLRMRKSIKRRAITGGMSRRAIKELVAKNKIKNTEAKEPMPVKPPSISEEKRLPITRQPLYTHTIITPENCVLEGVDAAQAMMVDCGFHISRRVKKSALKGVLIGKMAYAYPATVVSVVDGDTIRAEVDCGFDTFHMDIFRLRGINAPERDTEEGKAVTRFVARVLKLGCPIIVQTHKTDMYGRYVADILYVSRARCAALVAGVAEKNVHGPCADVMKALSAPERRKLYECIHKEGVYLNQELLDAELVERYE